MTYLAKNLKYLAKEAQIKQKALGERLGIEQSTVQRIMSGKTPYPRLDSLLAISAYFRCSLDDLVNRDIESFRLQPRQESQPARLDPQILDSALDCYRQISQQANFDIGNGTESGAIITAYEALARGAADLKVVAAVLNYAAEQGGGYGRSAEVRKTGYGKSN